MASSIKLWLGILLTACGVQFCLFGFHFIAMHSTYEEICNYDGAIDSCSDTKSYERDLAWAKTDFEYDWHVKAQEIRRDAEKQKCAIEDNLQKQLQNWEKAQATNFLRKCQDEYKRCLHVTTTTTTTNLDCTECNRYCQANNWVEEHEKFAELMGLSPGAIHTCGFEFAQVLDKQDIVPLLGNTGESCSQACNDHPERLTCKDDVMESWNYSSWNHSFTRAVWESGKRYPYDTFKQTGDAGTCIIVNESKQSLGWQWATYNGLYVGPRAVNRSSYCIWGNVPCNEQRAGRAGICACQRKEYYLERFTINNDRSNKCQSGLSITSATYKTDEVRAKYACKMAALKLGMAYQGLINQSVNQSEQLQGCILNVNSTADYAFPKGVGVYFNRYSGTYGGQPVAKRNLICKGACPNIDGITSCIGFSIPHERRDSCSYMLPKNTIRWLGNNEPESKPYGRTCASWCAYHGMTCVGMYDNQPSSCNAQSGNLGCHYEGSLADPATNAEVICQCKRQVCPWKPECGANDFIHAKCSARGCPCSKPSCTSTSTTTTTTRQVLEYCGLPNEPPTKFCECMPYEVTTYEECRDAGGYFNELGKSWVNFNQNPIQEVNPAGCIYKTWGDVQEIAQINFNSPTAGQQVSAYGTAPKFGKICTSESSITCANWSAHMWACGDTTTTGFGDSGTGRRFSPGPAQQWQCLLWCKAQGAGCCQWYSEDKSCNWKPAGVLRDMSATGSVFQKNAMTPHHLVSTICQGCDKYRRWCHTPSLSCEEVSGTYQCVTKKFCTAGTFQYKCRSGELKANAANIRCVDSTCSEIPDNEMACCKPFAKCNRVPYTDAMCPTGKVEANLGAIDCSDSTCLDTPENDLKCCKGLGKCTMWKNEWCAESKPEWGERGQELVHDPMNHECVDWNCSKSDERNRERCCRPKAAKCPLGYQFTAVGVALYVTWGPNEKGVVGTPVVGDMVLNSDLDRLRPDFENSTAMLKNGSIECIPACTCSAGVAGVAMVGPPLKLWWAHKVTDPVLLDKFQTAANMQGIKVEHNESLNQNQTYSVACSTYLNDRSKYTLRLSGVQHQADFKQCVADGFTEQHCFDRYDIPDLGCGYTGNLEIKCKSYRGYRGVANNQANQQRSFHTCGLEQDIGGCTPPSYSQALDECYPIPTPAPHENRHTIEDWLEVEELDANKIAPDPPKFTLPPRPTKAPKKCCEVYVGPTCERNRIELDRQVTGFLPNMEVTITWWSSDDPPELQTHTQNGLRTKSPDPLVRPAESRRRRESTHSPRQPCHDLPSGKSCFGNLTWPAGLIELNGPVTTASAQTIPSGANISALTRSGGAGSHRACFCTCYEEGYEKVATLCKKTSEPDKQCCPDLVLTSRTTRHIDAGDWYISVDDIHDGAGEWDPNETFQAGGYFPTKPCDQQVMFETKACPRIQVKYKKMYNWGYSSEPPFPECAHICNKSKADQFVANFCNATMTSPYNKMKEEWAAFEEKKRVMKAGRDALFDWSMKHTPMVAEKVEIEDCTSVGSRGYGSLGPTAYSNSNMDKLKLNNNCRKHNCKHNQCIKVKTPCAMDPPLMTSGVENTCSADPLYDNADRRTFECVDKVVAIGNTPMGLGFGITFCILGVLICPIGCVVTYFALKARDSRVQATEEKTSGSLANPPYGSSPSPIRLAAYPDSKPQAWLDKEYPPGTVMQEEEC